MTDAEQNYVAIEGEALAIAWTLEQSKYFTLGCEDLLVVTDHKPLVPILSDKDLNSISNPRIIRLKQRTLAWMFDIAHMPGISNLFSDAVSRHPSANGELSDGAIAEIALVGTIDRRYFGQHFGMRLLQSPKQIRHCASWLPRSSKDFLQN